MIADQVSGVTVPPELKQLLQPGNRLHIFYNDRNPNNMAIEVRAIVDKEWVVYRLITKTNIYGVERVYAFILRYEADRLMLVDKVVEDG